MPYTVVLTDIDLEGLNEQHGLIATYEDMVTVFGEPNSQHEGILWEGTIDDNKFTIKNNTDYPDDNNSLWTIDGEIEDISDMLAEHIFEGIS